MWLDQKNAYALEERIEKKPVLKVERRRKNMYGVQEEEAVH